MTASGAATSDYRAAQALAPPSPIVAASGKAAGDSGRALFDLLRLKWKEVPAGLMDRVETAKVLPLSDWELRDYWEGMWHESTTGPAYGVRGWYQQMYGDVFRGKRVLEIGSGCGLDAIHFIRGGARWHFADIVPSNLELIRRLLDAFGLDCEGMTLIEDLRSLDAIPDGFDFIYCQGSLINVPFDFARRETLHLLPHLRPGGRWIELCYPRERWAREGRLPFAEWGRVTDGEATPWMEWYDLERLRQRFAPVAVEPLLAFNFCDEDFNWFDLRIDAVPDRARADAYLSAAAPKRLPIDLAPAAFKRHSSTRVEAVHTSAGVALRVHTGPQIWSYALQGTLGLQTLRLAMADAPDDRTLPAVEVAITVQQGSVGVGLMADGLAEFIGQENRLAPRDEPHRLTLACPPGYERYHLLVRNNQGGNQPSVFTLHQMALTSVRAAEPAPANGLAGGAAPVIPLTGLLRRHLPAVAAEQGGATLAAGEMPVFVRAIGIEALAHALGFAEPSAAIPVDRAKDLRTWTTEADDAPILDYVYRNHAPRQHIALIEGNARADVVLAETEKALAHLPPGGLVLWRGFCPADGPMADLAATRSMVFAVHQGWRRWTPRFESIFWVRPSYLLVGVKRRA